MDSNYDKAFALYMDKVSGHLSPEDERFLEEKLAGDASFRAVWEQLEQEGAGIHHFIERLDPELSLQELHRQAEPVVRRPRVLWRRLAVPAAAALLIAIGGYYFFKRDGAITDKNKIASIVSSHQESIHLTLASGRSVTLDHDSSPQTVVADQTTLMTRQGSLQYKSEDTAQNTLSIPAGRNYRLNLSDGTEVILNAATTLRFPFTFGRTREVYVEGEAYFKIAKDAERPFIVHTSLTRIDVLGTSFNVNTYAAGNVTTSLVEGKVATRGSDGHPVTVQPGYSAEFNAGKGFQMEKFDQDDVLSWISGTYYFHNLPVDRLSDIMSRCYGLTIVMDKAKFEHRSITGLMDRNRLTEFLDDLETTAHIKYSFSGNELRLE